MDALRIGSDVWLKKSEKGSDSSYLIESDPFYLGELLGWLAEGLDFFCEVDAYGAPGDAAAASDTAGCAELIDPGR